MYVEQNFIFTRSLVMFKIFQNNQIIISVKIILPDYFSIFAICFALLHDVIIVHSIIIIV